MDWYTPAPSKVTEPVDLKSLKTELSDNQSNVVSVHDMRPSASAVTPPPPQAGWWAGDKYEGGFGPTQLFDLDYCTLRERSAQLFRENLYARGIIRRIVTNEINTGLTLECTPDADILGIDDDTMADWSENVENRFAIWARNPELCDWEGRRTFGQLQREAKLESLVQGDILVILHQSARYKLPQIQLVNGSNVDNPIDYVPPAGHTIDYGVERNAAGKHVAFHVQQEDGRTSKRVPAFGSKSGRRIAWLVYGTDKRMDDVRGEPILSLILQSLKEVDRYRDAAVRKATINSFLTFFIEKTQQAGVGSNVGDSAIRKINVQATDSDNPNREVEVSEFLPGQYLRNLQVGEKPTPHSTAGTDVNFGPFESSIIVAIAWALEIPPEILLLTFSSNYSASAAAINEYRMLLNMKRLDYGCDLCSPIYVEWFLSEILMGKFDAAGFLNAWNNPKEYDTYGAWIGTDWTGAIKPSTDLVKQAKGYEIMKKYGWITNERISRELTGTKFRKNVKRLRRENELLVEANAPLVEAAMDTETQGGDIDTDKAVDAISDGVIQLVEDAVENMS